MKAIFRFVVIGCLLMLGACGTRFSVGGVGFGHGRGPAFGAGMLSIETPPPRGPGYGPALGPGYGPPPGPIYGGGPPNYYGAPGYGAAMAQPPRSPEEELAIVKRTMTSALGPVPAGANYNGIHVVPNAAAIPPCHRTEGVSRPVDDVMWNAIRCEEPGHPDFSFSPEQF